MWPHVPSASKRVQQRAGGLRLLARCAVLASMLSLAAPAWSAAQDSANTDSIPASPPQASFAHSGAKTITYEIGNAINNFIILSAGSGAITGGAMLTAFNTLQSWTVYTTNDYVWETLYPPNKGESFDLQQSFWRTTLKYMTGKPVVASIKITALYIYTGSATTALLYGSAATVGASMVFFVNNLAWDFYDQTIAPRAGGCAAGAAGCPASPGASATIVSQR